MAAGVRSIIRMPCLGHRARVLGVHVGRGRIEGDAGCRRASTCGDEAVDALVRWSSGRRRRRACRPSESGSMPTIQTGLTSSLRRALYHEVGADVAGTDELR